MKLSIKDGLTFIGNLTTIGRATGKKRTVKLRLVFYNGKFYASRRTPHGDWLKNLLKNPSVIVEWEGGKVSGKARLVEDEELCKKISALKYSDERAKETRIVAEIKPET